MATPSKIVKPASADLLHLTVLCTERLAPHWARVTLGGDAGLDRVPTKANRLFGYLKFLRIPDGERPVMRNYSVRAFRPGTADAAAEIAVDFVLHGSAADGTTGPASRWAQTRAAREAATEALR